MEVQGAGHGVTVTARQGPLLWRGSVLGEGEGKGEGTGRGGMCEGGNEGSGVDSVRPRERVVAREGETRERVGKGGGGGGRRGKREGVERER